MDLDNIILEPGTKISFHFSSESDITLNEFKDLLDAIQFSINELNRKSKVSNRDLYSKYPTRISNVREGSLILDITLGIAEGIVAGTFLDLIKYIINNRIAKKNKNNISAMAEVEEGNNIVININIYH